MSINVPFTQFLIQRGATCSKAAAAVEGIEKQIAARQPLSNEQTLLATAFLNRSGANAVAERELAQAVGSPRDAASGLATGKRQHKPHSAANGRNPRLRVWGDPHVDFSKKRVSKIDAFTIKQTIVKDEVATAWPAKWKGFSLNGKGNSLSVQDIRTLTDLAARS